MDQILILKTLHVYFLPQLAKISKAEQEKRISHPITTGCAFLRVIPLTIKEHICALKITVKYLMGAAFQYQSIKKHMIIMELLG